MMTKYRDKSSLREMYATVYLISAFLSILLFLPPSLLIFFSGVEKWIFVSDLALK